MQTNSLVNPKILIPTIGRLDMLGRLLQPWTEADFSWDGIEIVVVQNGGGESCEAALAPFRTRLPIRYVSLALPCKSHALNQVIEEDPDAFIIFYDDDVRTDVSAVKNYIDGAKRYGPGHYFGGPVEPEYSGELNLYLWPFVPTCTKGLFLDQKEEMRTDFLFFLGHNWAAFAKDIMKCGGFDERLGPGKTTFVPVGDESDLQKTMSDSGCKAVFLPECKACHWVDTNKINLQWSLRRRFNKGYSEALFLPPSEPSFGNCITFMRVFTICLRILSLKIFYRTTRKTLNRIELYSILHRIACDQGCLAGLKKKRQFGKTPRHLARPRDGD